MLTTTQQSHCNATELLALHCLHVCHFCGDENS